MHIQWVLAEECKLFGSCSNTVPMSALGVLGVSQLISLAATGSALRLYYQQYTGGYINGKQLVRNCVLSIVKWPAGLVASGVGGAVAGGGEPLQHL